MKKKNPTLNFLMSHIPSHNSVKKLKLLSTKVDGKTKKLMAKQERVDPGHKLSFGIVVEKKHDMPFSPNPAVVD